MKHRSALRNLFAEAEVMPFERRLSVMKSAVCDCAFEGGMQHIYILGCRFEVGPKALLHSFIYYATRTLLGGGHRY